MYMRRKIEFNGAAMYSIEPTIRAAASVDRMRLFRSLALKVNSPAAAARMLARLRKVAQQQQDGRAWIRGHPLRD